MTSDRKALLAAIAAHPEEDTPRLMYADWLDENAQNDSDRARAHLIRVQVELANVRDNTTRGKYLREEEEKIFKKWEKSWKKPYKGTELLFDRGFPNSVRVDPSAPGFHEEFRLLLENEPVIQVSLYQITDTQFEENRDLWKNIRSLSFSSNDLAGNPHNPLTDPPICGDGILRFIAYHPQYFPQLEVLSLMDQQVQDAAVIALAQHARDFPQLKLLNLEFNPIGDAAAQALAQHSQEFTRLKTLCLGNTQIDHAGGTALGEADFPALDLLNLYQQQVIHDQYTGGIEAFRVAYNAQREQQLADHTLPITYGSLKKVNTEALYLQGLREARAPLPHELVNAEEVTPNTTMPDLQT